MLEAAQADISPNHEAEEYLQQQFSILPHANQQQKKKFQKGNLRIIYNNSKTIMEKQQWK